MELKWCATYGLICVKAIDVHVFLCTSLPSLALPLTMQYGTPILRQRAGRKTTSWEGKGKEEIDTTAAQANTQRKAGTVRCSSHIVLLRVTVLRVKKLVCFDPHGEFRWRNSNIIARDDSRNRTLCWGEMHSYLNWVHIVGNDDQLGFLALHQRGDGVHT